MIVLAHPTGNTFFRAAARSFYSRGWLQELHSSLCWDPSSPWSRLLPASLATQLERRAFPEVPLSLQRSYPWREVLRLALPGRAFPSLQRHESGPLSVDGIYRSFDRHVARRLSVLSSVKAVYAYEDSALQCFRVARSRGVRCVYDLPIGHWRAARQIFSEERELLPAWSSTLTGLADSDAKLARKDEELALADAVVVPSRFVADTLANLPGLPPIHVVPFGAPQPISELPPSPTSGPLRLLYVGSLGQRKGLAYALDAVASLGSQVCLTLIGRPTSLDCGPLNAALQEHHWIPSLPHAQILAQMQQHDVLLLPSLFEGFALVIHEALSQGLPVIATANTGATESVRDGVEGFIVPIRDSDAIADRLQSIIEDRERLQAMRRACLQRAEERTWLCYEQALASVLSPMLPAPLMRP